MSLSFRGLAQSPASYVFRHVTTGEGLASNKVYGILGDDRGFMWISTLNGFQRYDGYSFSTWHHNPADTTSLSMDESVCLLNDPDKNIWLASWPWGFTIFNPLSGKCRRVVNSSLTDAVSACQDKDGNTWLITPATLEEYDRTTHTLISFKQCLPKGIFFSRPIFYDSSTDRLYINTYQYGVCIFDRREKKFYDPLHNPRHLPLLELKEKGSFLTLDRDGYLWINTGSGKVLRVQPDSGNTIYYYLRDPAHPENGPANLRVNCAMQDREGTVWLGTSIGLVQQSKDRDSLELIREKSEDPNGFHSDGEIHCLSEDPEGNVWVGTDCGIDIFNPGKQKFLSFLIESSDSTTLKKYSVLNFLERDSGDIWIATYGGGIFVYDRSFHLKEHFTADPVHPHDPHQLPHGNVWSFLARADGRIVIGMQHGWLSMFDPATGTFNNRQPPGLQQLTISNMLFDKDSTIWMALYHGVGKWDTRKDRFTAYRDFFPFRGDTQSVALDLVTDRHYKIWVATIDHGLQQFDPWAARFTMIDTPDIHQPQSISSIALQSIIIMGDTLMAMGTADAGIDIYNTVTRQFSYITTADGLPSNNVTALYYHPPGSLWAATEQGLCQVDLPTRHVTTYGAEDGIARNDFTDLLRFYRLRNGHVLAGYKGGFVAFNPDSLASREPPRNVTITGIQVFEQPLSVDSILHGSDTAIFSHSQNFISIQYASLSYTEPDRIKYYYQLEGVDHGWVNAGRGRVASYTDLPGGHYLFKVKCENNDHIPCSLLTSFYIVIVPPFWRTTWFYVLVIAVALALLYGIYRYRIGQILELQDMRNKISKDLHDDLGATLSSIAVLSEVARNTIQRGLPQQSFPMLEKISTYSRDMVDKMRDIVWAINPGNDSLDNIVKRLHSFSTEACSDRGIFFDLNLHKDFVDLPVPMHMRKNLYLICKEAIYNAIRHSGGDRIAVSFDASAGHVVITIADNGKGFGGRSPAGGNGLNNMRSRAEEIRATLDILPGDQGTVVKLRLAVPKIRG